MPPASILPYLDNIEFTHIHSELAQNAKLRTFGRSGNGSRGQESVKVEACGRQENVKKSRFTRLFY